MLARSVLRSFCSTARCSARLSSSSPASVPPRNPNLHRDADQRDITQMDIMEERIRSRGIVREQMIGGQKQQWAYRSEMVDRLGLDDDHRNIWIAFGIIIVFGFGAFVYVKSNVVKSRRDEMEERERIRRELNLQGVDRKKIGVVDN